MNTGFSDMDKYYQLEKWGPTADELYDDLSPAQWWTRNGAFNGSNVCKTHYGCNEIVVNGVTEQIFC